MSKPCERVIQRGRLDGFHKSSRLVRVDLIFIRVRVLIPRELYARLRRRSRNARYLGRLCRSGGGRCRLVGLALYAARNSDNSEGVFRQRQELVYRAGKNGIFSRAEHLAPLAVLQHIHTVVYRARVLVPCERDSILAGCRSEIAHRLELRARRYLRRRRQLARHRRNAERVLRILRKTIHNIISRIPGKLVYLLPGASVFPIDLVNARARALLPRERYAVVGRLRYFEVPYRRESLGLLREINRRVENDVVFASESDLRPTEQRAAVAHARELRAAVKRPVIHLLYALRDRD